MNMISKDHNYYTGYISLVIAELGNLPKTLEVGGYKLLLKSEFHVSIISTKKIAPLIDKDRTEEIEAEIVDFFLDYIKKNPLNEYKTTNEYRLVEVDERVTVVAMVNLTGIDELFNELGAKYGVELPVQPTHITLYCLQPDIGIGILTQEQLKSTTKIVDVPLTL